MAIARLLLLLTTVVAERFAATAPNPRPPNDQLREQHGSERVVPCFTIVSNTLFWSWAFLEGSVILTLSGHCPPGLARPLLHFFFPSTTDMPGATTTLPTALTTLTPTFLIGALLTIAGAALRVVCFHALGPHFTFELSIRPSQALVTRGVYGVVRHPSYTGALVLAAGWLLCVLDRHGSVVSVCADWARTCAWASSAGGGGGDGRADALGVVVTAIYMTLFTLLYVGMNQRMNKEDEMLENHFGDEWRAWAKKVPYRLVPSVY